MRVVRRLVAAALVAAAAYAGASTTPAVAAAGGCPDAEGVTVVVDFHDLGGGLQQTCDVDGGGRDAESLFVRAGYALTKVQRQPAFVCRINGVPADDPCVNTPPADAYWTLWWSDGTDGRWSYSSLAASGLKIPEGGYVAFSWNEGSGQDKPGMTPKPRAAPSPTPTSKPSKTPTAKPTPTPTAPATTSAPPSATSAPTPTASATKTASAKPTKKPKPSEATSPTTDPMSSASVAPTDEDTDLTEQTSVQDSAVPAWVVFLVIGGLLMGAVAIAVVRRRRHRTPLGP